MEIRFISSDELSALTLAQSQTFKTIVYCESANSLLSAQIKILELGIGNRAMAVLKSEATEEQILLLARQAHSGFPESNVKEDNPAYSNIGRAGHRPISEIEDGSERICVLLRHWDAFELSEQCIEDLYSTSYSSLEIALLDDASQDLSFLQLFFRFPEIHVIRSLHKLEYCATFNLLALYARRLQAKYIFVVNNDTRNFSRNIFHQLVLKLQDPTIGIVSSRVMDYKGNLIVKQDRKWLGIQFNIATEGYLIPMKVWDLIGGFNLSLVRFTEDLELVFQLQKLGYKQGRVDDAYFDHLGHGSSARLNFVPVYYFARNLIWIQKIYFPKENLIKLVIRSIQKTWPVVIRENSLNSRRYVLRKVLYLVMGLWSGFFTSLGKRPSMESFEYLLTSKPLGRIKSRLR
jgi:GT2 family glycosyltransferase